MAVGDPNVFPGFLTPVLTQLFFPKPPTTFLTCFCRGERRKYAGKKSRLNRGSNSQPPGHESDTLTTEPPRRGTNMTEKFSICIGKGEKHCGEKKGKMLGTSIFPYFPYSAETFSVALFPRAIKTGTVCSLFPKQTLDFTCLQYNSFENTGKRRNCSL